jgi:hypothetical protein
MVAATIDKAKCHTRPTHDVQAFLQEAIRGEVQRPRGERRAHVRYSVSMSVRVIPLDDHKEPIAEPFYAVARDISIAGSFVGVTRDVSAGGISMYHTRPIQEKFLKLELTAPRGRQLHVDMEVLRCCKAGPFYEIAGRFTGDAASAEDF